MRCCNLLSELPIKEQGSAGKSTLAGWVGGELAENLHAFLFNEDLSNDTTFSQILLDGKHL
jgi:hypothetical protein